MLGEKLVSPPHHNCEHESLKTKQNTTEQKQKKRHVIVMGIISGCSTVGSTRCLGHRGRECESLHSDQSNLKEVIMFSKELKKSMYENRLARLETNGKDNYPIRKKIMRKLKSC